MKKIIVVLLMTVASSAVACSSAEKSTDEKREVSSEVDKAEQYKAHQKYLNQIDKIR